jgi:hypothetical protein
VNNVELFNRSQFSRVGAFVQQDDILPIFMTPRELFHFASRLRTNLTPA